MINHLVHELFQLVGHECVHVVDKDPELFWRFVLPVPTLADDLHHALDPLLVEEGHQLAQVV